MDIQTIERQLAETSKELKAAIASGSAEQKAKIEGLEQKYSELQSQADAIETKIAVRHTFGGSGDGDVLLKALEDSPEFSRIKELGKGSAIIKLEDLPSIKRKTQVDSSTLGYGTAGVIMPQGVGGVVPLAERRLFLRDLLFRGNRLTTGAAFFIQENSFTNQASPQVSEGHDKGESADTFTTTTRNVATIAHWIPISRQALDDAPAIAEFIRRKLIYGLRYKEEEQFLSGSGAGADLAGLITSAATFDTALLGAGEWNKADVLRRAMQQVEAADEVPAGFFVLNPADWADIELSKNAQFDYLVGNPRAAGTANLWGKPVVVTTAIASGSFLAGSSESAEVLDRLDATIEISLDYSDYRARNLAMILCEARTVLLTYRPNAFVTGSLTTSP